MNRLYPGIVAMLSFLHAGCSPDPGHQPTVAGVIIESDGWELVGDLTMPRSKHPVPMVLMLNKAAGDRHPYAALSQELAERGIASIALDMRGHGESTNLGDFVPGAVARDPLIWDSEPDVNAAIQYIGNTPLVDASRIGVVGSSYSGEEMAEAARITGYARAYVALSPGSFSDVSIANVDSSGVPWLFVTTSEDRFLKDIVDSLRARSSQAEILLLPGNKHATDIIEEHDYVNAMIAEWLHSRLRE